MPIKDATKRAERHSQWLADNQERVGEYFSQYREANREKIRERERQRRATIRAAVFDHYGRSCACCGTLQRLTVDHISGDGTEHRENLFGRRNCGSDAMYCWLVRNDFPEGFQILCRPCNASKGGGPRCRLGH